MMQDQQQKAHEIIWHLSLGKTSQVPASEWSEALHQAVLALLTPSQRLLLQVQPSTIDKQLLWISLGDAVPPLLPEAPMVYPLRSWLKKMLPLLVLVAILTVTALIGSGLDRLVSAEFLLYSPFILGALVAYAQNYRKPAGFPAVILSLLIFMMAIILLSVVVLHEGVICLIMASPIIFGALLSGAGAMHLYCRWLWKPHRSVYSLAVLPLLLILIPEQPSNYLGHTQHTQIIEAPASVVWQQINHVTNIRPSEFKPSVVYGIGVPYPLSGVTRNTAEGQIRDSVWQKGVRFEELIQQSVPNQYLRWTYRFKPDSFPKGALDDHVKVGGKYFDVLDTAFTLTPLDAQRTQLTLDVNYRVSTEVNFYAGPLADWMFKDFSEVILDFYKKRSEQAAS